MFSPESKDSVRVVLKHAVTTALATIVIAFFVVVPLRDRFAPDAEKRTEGIVNQINSRVAKLEKRLEEEIRRGNRWTDAHRNHSCAQHAITFIASLDTDEIKAFNKKEVRRAFSKCPKKLRYSIVRRGGPSPQHHRSGD